MRLKKQEQFEQSVIPINPTKLNKIIDKPIQDTTVISNELKFVIPQILKKYLTPKKFMHCVVEEGQLRHLYRSQQILFPTQKEMIRMKACPFPIGEFCGNCKLGCLNYNRVK